MQIIDAHNELFATDGIASLDRLQVIYHEYIASVSCPGLAHVGQCGIYDNAALTSVSLPDLKAHTSSNTSLQIMNNPLLTSINLDALVSSMYALDINNNPLLPMLQLNALTFVKRYVSIASNASLAAISLPSLVSTLVVGGFSFSMNNSPNLASISFPKYLPTSGHSHNFAGDALTQASVDHVLSRFVASKGYAVGTISLEGGTNSTPSAAGLADVVTLQARGVVVNHN